MSLERFRHILCDIFDLESDSSRLSRIVNRTMYVLIFLSTAGVVLESITFFEPYREQIELFESFTVGIFALELILRLSVLDLLLRKYRKTWERWVLFFYYLIDFAAIVPPLILWFGLHVHFDYFLSIRLIRVFKAFRHDHSIEFIIRAVIKKKNELFKSAVLTLVFTVFLSVILFEAENHFEAVHSSPNRFTDIFTTFLWAMNIYFEEVSGFGSFTPITPMGQLTAAVLGFMKIAIVVIPTGIIASGFLEVLEDDRIKAGRNLLYSAFRKKTNNRLGKSVYPSHFPMNELQNALHLPADKLLKIIEISPGFRVRRGTEADGKNEGFDLAEFYAYGELTAYGSRLETAGSETVFVAPESLNRPQLGYLIYLLSEEFCTDLLSVERFGAERLNPAEEHDFLNYRPQETPYIFTKDEQKRLRKLPPAQAAFAAFRQDIAAIDKHKQLILCLFDAKMSEAFRTEKLESDKAPAFLPDNRQAKILYFGPTFLQNFPDSESIEDLRKSLLIN